MIKLPILFFVMTCASPLLASDEYVSALQGIVTNEQGARRHCIVTYNSKNDTYSGIQTNDDTYPQICSNNLDPNMARQYYVQLLSAQTTQTKSKPVSDPNNRKKID